jgi:hypothetical protein
MRFTALYEIEDATTDRIYIFDDEPLALTVMATASGSGSDRSRKVGPEGLLEASESNRSYRTSGAESFGLELWIEDDLDPGIQWGSHGTATMYVSGRSFVAEGYGGDGTWGGGSYDFEYGVGWGGGCSDAGDAVRRGNRIVFSCESVEEQRVGRPQSVRHRITTTTATVELIDFESPTGSIDRPADMLTGELLPVFPNRVKGRATVPFTLPAPTRARMSLYDVLGREVARLFEKPLDSGRHLVRLDVDELRLASGFYVCRLFTEAGVASQRVSVVR